LFVERLLYKEQAKSGFGFGSHKKISGSKLNPENLHQNQSMAGATPDNGHQYTCWHSIERWIRQLKDS